MTARATLAVVFLLVLAHLAHAEVRSPGPVDAVATVYGVRIHYVEAGSGPPVLLLHGLADDAHVWDRLLPALAADHRVIAVDLPGFGASDKPLLEYRPRTYSDFMARFLDGLGIGRASVVGSSLGGFVAALLAIDAPGRVDRLVLVDAAGYADLAASLGARGLGALRLATREDLRYLAPLTFHDPRYAIDAAVDAGFEERMRAGDGYAVGRIVESIARHDDALDRAVRAIARPTLVVWGREDRLIPLAFGRRFARDIRGARLVILPKCGHLPQVECPGALADALVPFLHQAGQK